MCEGGVEDEVQPVEGGLQVEVVPKAVAEDEGVGAFGLGWGELGAEAGELFGGDGEADHHLDWREIVSGLGGRRGNDLLITLTESALHARLSGSLRTTSAVR